MGIMCHLYPSLKCNLECKFCYVDANRYVGEESENNLLQIASFLNELDVDFIHVEGGEPFLCKNLESFVKASKNNQQTIIVTNATCVTKQQIENFLAASIKKFVVSIDGDANMHNHLRGVTCYDEAVKGIKLLLDCGADVTVTQTLCRENIEYMENIVATFLALGVNRFRFGDVLVIGRAEGGVEDLKQSDYSAILKNFSNIKDKYKNIDARLSIKGDINKITLPENLLRKDFPCSNNGKQLAIVFNGDVFSCSNMITQKEYFIGNLFKEPDVIRNFLINQSTCSKCNLGCKAHKLIS